MSISKYWFVLGVVISVVACEGGLTTTLDVDPPEFEDLMVVDAFFDNVVSLHSMRVGKTFSSLDRQNRDSTLLNDASASFWKNGVKLFDFTSAGLPFNNSNFVTNENLELEEGSVYEVQVEHPDYGLAKAEQRYPKALPAQILSFVKDGGVDIDGDEVSRLRIEIEDPADEENYYTIGLVTINDNGDVNPVYIWSFDPLIEDDGNYDELLLPDNAFNGKRYSLEILTNKWNADLLLERGFLVWKNVTEDFYRYNTTLRTAIEAEDFAGFTEPALIHSNFENALGCFLLSNIVAYKIEE